MQWQHISKKIFICFLFLTSSLIPGSRSLTPVFAQGCAMCKTAVANSANGAEMSSQINLAVFVLLIPVVVLITAFSVVVYRYRNA